MSGGGSGAVVPGMHADLELQFVTPKQQSAGYQRSNQAATVEAKASRDRADKEDASQDLVRIEAAGGALSRSQRIPYLQDATAGYRLRLQAQVAGRNK